MNIIKKAAKLHADMNAVQVGPVAWNCLTGLLNEHNARQIGNLAIAGYEKVWEKAWFNGRFGYGLDTKEG